MLRLCGGIATISRIESCFRDEVKLPNAGAVRATGQIFANPCFVYAAAAVISQFHEVSVSSVVNFPFASIRVIRGEIPSVPIRVMRGASFPIGPNSHHSRATSDPWSVLLL